MHVSAVVKLAVNFDVITKVTPHYMSICATHTNTPIFQYNCQKHQLKHKAVIRYIDDRDDDVNDDDDDDTNYTQLPPVPHQGTQLNKVTLHDTKICKLAKCQPN